jgi:hypothetical protein
MMLAPTNEVWKKLIEEYEPYFDYPEKLEERDSMAYTMSRLAIVRGTTFSRTYNSDAALQDSAMSNNCILNYTSRKSMWGAPFEYFQYYMPNASKGALNHSESMTCSNGEMLKASEWNIDKQMTFHQYIIADVYDLDEVSKNYDASIKDTVNTVDVYTMNVPADNKAFYDKLWNNRCAYFKQAQTAYNHTANFILRGVLSNIPYDIYVVYAPALSVDTTATSDERMPTKLGFNMIAPGISGYPKSGVALINENEPCYVSKGKSYQPNPDSVCYIKVAENFEFPKCTRGVDDENLQAYLQIETKVSNNEQRKNQFIRDFRINCILCVPHGSLELVDELPATVGTGNKMTKIPASAQGTPGVLMYPHGKYDDRDYKAWYMLR